MAATGCRPRELAAAPLCLAGGFIVDVEGERVTLADIAIEDGVIIRIGPDATRDCAGRTLDVSGAYIVSGLVDLHVHGWRNRSPRGAHEVWGRDRVRDR